MSAKKHKNKVQLRTKITFLLACIAALLYCSWPLGYLLNPAVGKHELASQLEAPHQPFNWLFILMDVLTGVLTIAIGILQIRARRQKFLTWSIVAYVTFGTLVSLAALIPLNCDPGIQQCGALIDHPATIAHGAASILSCIALLASMLLLVPTVWRRNMSRTLKVAFAIMVCSWTLFGIGSLVEMSLKITGNTLQYYFITICSLSLLLVVWTIGFFAKRTRRLAYNTSKAYDSNKR